MLGFIRSDPAEMSDGTLIDLFDDVVLYCGFSGGSAAQVRAELTELRIGGKTRYALSRPQAVKLQEIAKDAVAALKAGRKWRVPHMPDDITIVAGRGERKPPYNFKEIPLTREYTASLNAIFAITTADLLQEGWTSIRWCKREKCGKPFYPVRRQSYCSPQCSQLVRSAKHAEGDKDKKEGKTG